MTDYVVVDEKDARYETLKKGFNLRWPDAGRQVKDIYVCRTEQEAEDALQATRLGDVHKPTIRSGGHCYEGFVSNNPQGVIIDIGMMTGMNTDVTVTVGKQTYTYGFQVLAGNQNWDGYLDLYKWTGKTVPGGSCYSVGAGGHIVGGGYGLLSRLHGLTVDWLTAVDILIVQDGKTVTKVHARADNEYKDLFQLCRGGGGGTVGLITSYYFDDMPVAPQLVAVMLVQLPWGQFQSDKAKFKRFLDAYAKYFIDNDTVTDSYGLFTLLKLTHVTARNIGLVVQYTDLDGKLGNTAPLMDFYHQVIEPFQYTALTTYIPGGGAAPFVPPGNSAGGDLPPDTMVFDWLYATQTLNGSGNNQRGKYKSSYMKQGFSDTEVDALLQYLTQQHSTDADFSQSLVQVDSYGGAINHGGPTNPDFDPTNNQTAVPQRKSVLKLQYQTYWTDPANDQKHLDWLKEFYWAVHKKEGFNGTPYPFVDGDPTKHSLKYEGCYINYPDIDMLTGQTPDTPGYDWVDLYYPGLRGPLIAAKRKYDPYNVFNHAMSIPTQTSAQAKHAPDPDMVGAK